MLQITSRTIRNIDVTIFLRSFFSYMVTLLDEEVYYKNVT